MFRTILYSAKLRAAIVFAVAFFFFLAPPRAAFARPNSAGIDCNIWWGEVLHDTFDSDYRSLVGPTTPNNTVKLRLRVAQGDINSARVRVWDDRTNTQTYYPMSWDGLFDTDPITYDWWYADIAVGSQPTILYYFFELNDDPDNNSGNGICDQDFYVDDDVKFYGGGMGAMSDNYDDSRSFQLTVYDPAFSVPSWMKQGVVYQIYPDRFRDGNASNNPSAPRFFYGDNSGTIYRSNTTTWNTKICDPRNISAPTCSGNYSNNFYGGDLQGITDKINQGYFDNLGVSVLYLNPIFKSPSNHKYDTDDYMTIDPDFGTLTDWSALVTAANNHNLKIILDGVFNHTSSDSKYFDRYGRFAETGACESTGSTYRNWYYFSDTSTIHAPGRDGDPNTGTLVYCADNPPGRTYEAWYGYSSLPKLQANSTAVRNLIWNNGTSSVGPYWTQQGASGWRFDVGADVDSGLTNDASNDYWEGFRTAVRAQNSQALTLGEEWGDASAWLLGNEWDSVMNYRFRSAALAWLFTGCVAGEGCSGGATYEENDSNSFSSSGAISYISPSQFNARLRSIQEDYPPMAFKAMMNLEGSHDTQRLRFLLKKINNNNDAAAVQRMKEWWLFAFTYAGAPTLYYGDEIGLSQDGVWDGSRTQDDPYNRVPFPWDDTPGDLSADTTNLLPFARKMGSLRWAYPVLQDGDVQHGIVIDDANKLYGFARTNGSHTALIVLNRDSAQHNATITGLNASPYNLSNGTTLYDAIEGNTYTVSGGSVTVPVNATWGVVLVQSSGVQTPSVPAQFSVTPNGGQNILAWNNVTTDTNGGRELAYQYTVHRSQTQGFTPDAGNKIATVTPPNFGSTNGRVTYTDTNPPPAPMEGTHATNYYAVCAQNAGGGQNCTSPGAPTALDLVAFDARVKQNQVRLKWQTGSEMNVVGFNVLRRQGKQGAWIQQNAQIIPAQASGQAQGSAYAYQDAPNVGTYLYRLEIVHTNGASTQSQAVRVRVAASCPARPALLSPQTDAELTKRRVPLAWQGDACAKTWNVMVRADNPQGQVVFKRGGLTQPNVTTTKLEAGKTYVWRVAACGDNGCARSKWTTFHITASAEE